MSAPEEDAGPRHLRTRTHQDLSVTVRRDLTGSGRLARGGQTRFSFLHLRSVGRAAPQVGEEAPAGAPAVRPPVVPEPARVSASPTPSPLRRLLRWLGLDPDPAER